MGDSLGVIIHKKTLRAAGWWQSDFVMQNVVDGKIVIENITQKKVRPIHTRADYGDNLNSKP